MFPSSRGLGHRPFTAVTGVRIPLGTPKRKKRTRKGVFFVSVYRGDEKPRMGSVSREANVAQGESPSDRPDRRAKRIIPLLLPVGGGPLPGGKDKHCIFRTAFLHLKRLGKNSMNGIISYGLFSSEFFSSSSPFPLKKIL